MNIDKIFGGLFLISILLMNAACSAGAASDGTATVENTADFVVTSTEDSGAGSLREAVELAESGSTITFDPSVFDPSSPAAISLSDSIFLGKGNITLDASNAGVILDGSMGVETGIFIQSSGNIVYGFKFIHFQVGLMIDGDGDQERARNNQIGGDRSVGNGPQGQGNCFVANDYGISIQRGAGDSTVIGNFIGLEADGKTNGNEIDGVIIQADANHNTIGPDNIIANNGRAGINVFGGSRDNTITRTLVYNNQSGNVIFSNGGNYETEIAVEEIRSIDSEQGYISGEIFTNSENEYVEIYSGDSTGPRYFEGVANQLNSIDNGRYDFNFLKGSSFQGEYLYITAYDREGNSSPFSEPIPAVDIENAADSAFIDISSVLSQPEVVWEETFDDLDEIGQWMIDQDRFVENSLLVLSPTDTDWHLSKVNEAVACYAAESGKFSQAVHITFSFAGARRFQVEVFYKNSGTYEDFKDGGDVTAEFNVMFNSHDLDCGDLPCLGGQAADYVPALIPMQGATTIEPDTRYEMLIAIDNDAQELFAAVWEPGKFDHADFVRLQNDEKLLELTSTAKPWGFGIFQWGGENTLYIDNIQFIAFDGFTLPEN